MQVTSSLHIIGKPHIEHSGVMKISNLQSSLVAKLKFESSSRLSWGEAHQVHFKKKPKSLLALHVWKINTVALQLSRPARLASINCMALCICCNCHLQCITGRSCDRQSVSLHIPHRRAFKIDCHNALLCIVLYFCCSIVLCGSLPYDRLQVTGEFWRDAEKLPCTLAGTWDKEVRVTLPNGSTRRIWQTLPMPKAESR